MGGDASTVAADFIELEAAATRVGLVIITDQNIKLLVILMILTLTLTFAP